MKNRKLFFLLPLFFLAGCQDKGGNAAVKALTTPNNCMEAAVPATRGMIFDKNGQVLAKNILSYSLEIMPEKVVDMDDTLQRLQLILQIPQYKIDAFNIQYKLHQPFESIPLLLQLSTIDATKFSELKHSFAGVNIHKRLMRHYPYAELTAHVVGYVGSINEQELKALPESECRSIYSIGKTGIERSYEDALRGHPGYAEAEGNGQAGKLGSVEPVAGADIYLTLDIGLQKTAYDALGDFNGGVVALDIEMSGVLVQVSKASFDSNLFVSGISSKGFVGLNESKNKPLVDRVIQGLYPPGSTIKPFIALAGLEYGVRHKDHALFCPGYYQLPGKSHKYRDWKKFGHGKVDLDTAITQSCDVYFYDLSVALGIDRMSGFLQQFGFGQKTGIDLKGEKVGLFPSREWKRIHRDQPWFPGETLITGIGQGFTQVTPMQLVAATATLANKGKVVVPHLAERLIKQGREVEFDRPVAKNIPLNVSNAQDIIDAMVHVVNSPEGAANGIAKGLDYQIAGKTGMAQVYMLKMDEQYNEDEIAFNMRDHALFIAFAPADNPKIAVAVVAEHGSFGSVAGSIAVKVIEQYLQGKEGVR